jgi:anthranilate phosphoribosyltransferase
VNADRSGPTWPTLLSALLRHESLSAGQTAWAMNEIMAGEATSAQLAAFAVLLRAKGETPAEISGLVQTMLARAAPVRISGHCVDVVGTGGDQAHTVNISTMAALVVAGSGRPVVKHGNRAASSACGAADVLEELGVAIDLDGAGVATTVTEVGIGFCFAPVFHAGLRHAGAPRRELGVPTAFNVVGPLTNPARPPASAIGCADPRMAGVMAEVLAGRGDAAVVFRGDDGLDELTTTTTSSVWVATGGDVATGRVDPTAFDIRPAPPEALRGADRVFNAAVVTSVLGGDSGPVRDAVLLNAAAGIAAFDGFASSGHAPIDATGAVAGLDDALAAGLVAARQAIDSGEAAELLGRWASVSQRVKRAATSEARPTG